MNILFLTNVPSPYRVDFFNELGKSCNLTVLFEKTASDERDSSWKDYKFENFKGVFLKGRSISTDMAFCPGVRRYVKDKSFDCVICGNFSTPTGILAVRCMKRHKINYFLEADGAVAKSGRGIKEKIKKSIIGGAFGYFSTSKSCDGYFSAYGAQGDRIYRYPFTSLFDKDIVSEPPNAKDKAELKRKLNLAEEKIIISVGRFSYLNGYGKGYDTLLRVCERLPESIGVYIIGDEPTEEFVRWKEEKKLERLHYLPFMKKKELFEYYKAADLSVLLTRGDAWGLVVNEAMANGLPVITTDACVGGVEMIESGVNGYIVPVDSDKETERCVLSYLSMDSKSAQAMQKQVISTVKEYTIEKMVSRHFEVIKESGYQR